MSDQVCTFVGGPLRELESKMRERLELLLKQGDDSAALEEALCSAIVVEDTYRAYNSHDTDGFFSRDIIDVLVKKYGYPELGGFDKQAAFRDFEQILRALLESDQSVCVQTAVEMLVLFDLYMRNHHEQYASPLDIRELFVSDVRLTRAVKKFAKYGLKVPVH